MTEAISHVHTSEVTYAARDSDFDGFDIHAGDYMALTEGSCSVPTRIWTLCWKSWPWLSPAAG